MSTLPRDAAIVVLGPSALGLAARIKTLLPGARIHATQSRVPGAEIGFTQLLPHLRSLFSEGTPIIGLCASGILVRALAPLIADKKVEPPVIAVAENGSVVVPLLGGHHGANAMARAIAAMSGGVAAITTAGDLRFDLALDEPPPGWRIANPERMKAITAALLAGEPVALEIAAGDAAWIKESGVAFADQATHKIRVTDRAITPDEAALVFHPPVLALGVGCERGAAVDELKALVTATLEKHGLAAISVALVTSLDLKADEDAVQALAVSLGVPARFFTSAALLNETKRLKTPSEIVFRAVGCYGVAEGAALAAAGPDGDLIVAKQSYGRVTCAIARAPVALEATKIGKARGSLTIIGIGPGDAASRTPAADAALAAASDIVGYGLYLDLLGGALSGKTRHESNLGAEEDSRAQSTRPCQRRPLGRARLIGRCRYLWSREPRLRAARPRAETRVAAHRD